MSDPIAFQAEEPVGPDGLARPAATTLEPPLGHEHCPRDSRTIQGDRQARRPIRTRLGSVSRFLGWR